MTAIQIKYGLTAREKGTTMLILGKQVKEINLHHDLYIDIILPSAKCFHVQASHHPPGLKYEMRRECHLQTSTALVPHFQIILL